MTRNHRRVTAAIICLTALGTPAAAQTPDRFRMIVRSGVTCHSVADAEAPIVHRYHTGDVIMARRDTMGQGGLWYFDAWGIRGIAPTCWVRGDLTVPSKARGDADAYVMIADHALRRDSISFEELVEVINLIDTPSPSWLPVLSTPASSALLQFRRLQLVERASGQLNATDVANRPLYRAWIIAQDSTLWFFEPAARWFVPASLYWELYERNARAPWADAVAWHAAKSLPGREECYSECLVDLIAQGPQRYWTALPQGDSVGGAIELALRIGAQALAAAGEEPPTRAQLNALRASLAPVHAPRKQDLLRLIERLEATTPRPDRNDGTK